MVNNANIIVFVDFSEIFNHLCDLERSYKAMCPVDLSDYKCRFFASEWSYWLFESGAVSPHH